MHLKKEVKREFGTEPWKFEMYPECNHGYGSVINLYWQFTPRWYITTSQDKLFKAALDNILICFFFLFNFIYQVNIDCYFTNSKRKIQKFLLKVKESFFVKHAWSGDEANFTLQVTLLFKTWLSTSFRTDFILSVPSDVFARQRQFLANRSAAA